YGIASGQIEDARVRMKEAIPLLRGLAEKHVDLLPLLGESLNTLGGIEATKGMWDDAGEDFEQARKVQEPLAESDAIQFGPTLGMIYNNLSAYHMLRKNKAETEAFLRRAVDIRRKVASGNPDCRPEVLKSLFSLSAWHRSESKWQEAIEDAN